LHFQFLATEDRYLEYLFDGNFFDEAPTDCNASDPFLPTQFLYYETLTNYVREKADVRISVLNPGTYSQAIAEWGSRTS
jgi:hypothetical protein